MLSDGTIRPGLAGKGEAGPSWKELNVDGDKPVANALTRVPGAVWTTTFVVVCGLSSWAAGRTVLAASGVLGA